MDQRQQNTDSPMYRPHFKMSSYSSPDLSSPTLAWRSWLLALLLVPTYLLAAAPAAAAGGAPAKTLAGWHAETEDALAEARSRKALVLVDLYADWCGWCKVLEERVFTSPEFERYAQKFVRLRVDTEDGGQGSALQSRFSIESLPMLLILDADKIKVGQVAGYQPTADFIEAIESQIQAWQMLTGHYEQVLASGEGEVLEELAEEFHHRGDGKRAAGLYEKLLKNAQSGSDVAWLSFMLADAYRLDRRFADAKRVNEQAGAAAAKLADEKELAEQIDLLHFYIAQDNGDCKGAVSSLERFLASHPASALGQELKQTLKVLKTEPACT